MTEQDLSPGDVVQIDPDAHPKLATCFAVVDEVKGWGAVATVPIAASPSPNQAPVRLAHGTFKRIGKAEWVTELLAEALEPKPVPPESAQP